ncbi:MAG TPA: G8 domain-containing protein [Gemmatimonadales bacterium]|jgi:cell migration-inducing and hyaluronan-binding protein
MQGQLAICARVSVLALALFACSTDDSTGPTGGGPTQPPIALTSRWSDASSWPDGVVPAAGAAVTISADKALLLDVSPPALASLRIDGALVFDNLDLAITSGSVVVGGTLRIGTSGSPFTHSATITLTGADDGTDVMGMGNKVLGVLPGGTLDLHGEARTGWTRLAATASAGANQLTLETAPGWRAGDRIVVASTEFDPNRAEVGIVQSISGANVTLSQPLLYSHYGQLQTYAGTTVDERAEVGLLTRNIVIQGDSASSAGGFGGHMMGMGGTLRVEGVELHFMGQKGKMARYPMHWHMMGPVDGQYFQNSSVWKSFNRCVTVHGSDNAHVENNVCYDHLGHGYFLEDGAETGNTIAGNLGLGTKVTADGEGVLPTDTRAATFWITNPDNMIHDNVAAGSQAFGFWFALPASPTGLSTGQPDLPRTNPLRQFSDNVAHSNRRGGLQVDDGPMPDGNTQTTYYSPRSDPNDGASAVEADFKNFKAWKHSGRAVWLRGANLKLSGAVLADNAIGATFASYETSVQDALFIGETGNNTTPLSAGTPRRGYEFYDGTVGADRVTFVNYSVSASIPSSALGFLRNNGFSVSTANYAGDLEFVNANLYYLETPHADKDGDKAAVFLDRDGKVSGSAGAYVVPNSPFLATPSCTLRPEWNAYVCPNRYVGLSVRSDVSDVAPLTVVRDDAASLGLVGVPGNPDAAFASVLPNRQYTLQFGVAVPAKPKLYLDNVATGEWVRVTLPYPQAPVKLVRDYWAGNPMGAVGSLGELDASAGDKYFYDAGTTMLHLKLMPMPDRDWVTIFVDP